MKNIKNWHGVPLNDEEEMDRIARQVDEGKPYIAPALQFQIIVIGLLLMLALLGIALLVRAQL